MRIVDNQGNVYEGPDGPVPAGFRKAGSPLMEKITKATDPLTVLSPLYKAAGQAAQYSPTATIPAGISALMGRTPEQTQATRETMGNITRDVAMAAALPMGKAGLLGRIAQQAGLAGVQENLASGQTDPAAIAKAGGLGAVFGLLGEAGTAIPRIMASKRAGQTAKQAWEELVREHAASQAAQKAATEAANVAEKGAHSGAQTMLTQASESGAAKRLATTAASNKATLAAAEAKTLATSEQAAAHLMDFYKQQVPYWSKYPSTVEGLQEAVLGAGQKDLSAAYDAAMKAAKAQAKGKPIQLTAKNAEALGLKGEEKTSGGITYIIADAADAIEAATGMWKEAPAAYRAVFNRLDKLGIGDPQVRSAYKAGQSLIDMVDVSDALFRKNGKDLFDPEKILAAMNDKKKINILRNRGMGDFFQGPMAELRQFPPTQKPQLLPKPEGPIDLTLPKFEPRPMPEPSELQGPPGYWSTKNPLFGHPWIGMMAGGAATGKLPGLSIPGEIAGLALSQKQGFGPYGAIQQPTLDMLGGLSGILGTLGREYTAPPGSMTSTE